MFDVDAALMTVIEEEASDLHLKVPSPPIIRQYGKLVPIEGAEQRRPEDTEATLFHMLTDEAKLEAFRNEREVDFSYSIPGLARFRVNAFVQRGSVSLVCRAIPFQIKSAEELMLPPVIPEIADEERGLILMTGTTGSGKSTTLAAMIDHINSHHAKHIVTIEDPVEFLHRDKLSIINQREVGEDTSSFARALRRVLRQDRAMLAGTLKAVVSQRLVPTADGQGRIASCEILRMTGRVRDMIVNPEETGRLHEVISEGGYYGMQTFDQALLAATHPHDFKLLVSSDGQRHTSIESVFRDEDAATVSGVPGPPAA